MRWLRWTAIGVMTLGTGYVITRVVGAQLWARRTAALLTRLDGTGVDPSRVHVDRRGLESLPPPVQRYLRLALTDGHPIVTAVHLTHTGTFNQSLDTPRWSPFTSEQAVRTQPPGFVWNATIAMAPGMPVRVHDAYVNGTGVLTASIFGLVSMVEQSGTPSLAEGELMRWLAESAWYPTVLLPGQGVTWRAVNDSSADASITDGGTTVTLRFVFGDDGLIARVASSGRMRTVGDHEARTPWEGRFWNFTARNGMRVPTEGEVGWRIGDAVIPYWRGTIVSAAYVPQMSAAPVREPTP